MLVSTMQSRSGVTLWWKVWKIRFPLRSKIIFRSNWRWLAIYIRASIGCLLCTLRVSSTHTHTTKCRLRKTNNSDVYREREISMLFLVAVTSVVKTNYSLKRIEKWKKEKSTLMNWFNSGRISEIIYNHIHPI